MCATTDGGRHDGTPPGVWASEVTCPSTNLSVPLPITCPCVSPSTEDRRKRHHIPSWRDGNTTYLFTALLPICTQFTTPSHHKMLFCHCCPCFSHHLCGPFSVYFCLRHINLHVFQAASHFAPCHASVLTECRCIIPLSW